MEETVWTGKVSISASNPDNWTDGLPNSYDKQGVVPEDRYDYDYDCDWDIADWTVLIRVDGKPAHISIASNCYLNGEAYAPQAIIDYVGSLVLDEPLSYGGEYGGLFSADVDFPTIRVVENYIIAASDASNWEKSQSHFVCSGSADDVDINRYLTKMSIDTPGYGKMTLTGGRFDIKDTVSIPSGVSLWGMGCGINVPTTHLSWSGSGTKDVVIYNSAAVHQNNQLKGNGIYDLQIDGNVIADSTGLRIRQPFFYNVKNVMVRSCTLDGIVLEASYGTHMSEGYVRECDNNGVKFVDYDGWNCTWNTLVNCNFSSVGTGFYGVYVESGGDILIDRCWFEQSATYDNMHLYVDDNSVASINVRCTDTVFQNFQGASHGIELVEGNLYINHCNIYAAADGKKGIVMTGGTLQMGGNRVYTDSSGAGIGVEISGLDTWEQVLIEGNYFYGNSASGYAIDVNAGKNIEITGNYFFYSGIYIDGSTTNTNVNDNNLRSIYTTNAIYLQGSACTVNGNTLYDIRYNGIYIDDIGNVINSNNIDHCCRQTDNTYDALSLDADDNVCIGNIIRSAQANLPRYGIHVNGDDCIVTSNYIDDTSTANIFEASGQTGNNISYNRVFEGTCTFVYGVGSIYKNNIGFIAQGEIRTGTGSLVAGNINGIFLAWANPEAQDILIKKVVIEITTAGGTAGTEFDVGIADDAAGTNRGVEFFDDLDGDTVLIYDSWVVGDGGTQTKWVLCQDSGSATDAFIVGIILTQNAATLAGKFYITYVGR